MSSPVHGQYSSPYQQYTATFSHPGYSPTLAYGQTDPQKGVPVPTVIAELPAAVPPELATTQQLNEDERLAQKLQELEVNEARRRSSSNLSSYQPSHLSFHAPSTPDLRSSYIRTANEARFHAKKFSSLTPKATDLFVQPQSEILPAPRSPVAPYGPESFGRPAGLNPSTLPEVIAGPEPISFHQTSNSPANYTASSPLPEVVVSPQPISSSENALAKHVTAHLPPSPVDHTLLPMYLEQHRQVPYPPQWKLPPVQATFYSTVVRARKADSWLDTPEAQKWHTVRFTELASNPTAPSFQISFQAKHVPFQDPKIYWTMTTEQKTHGEWKYKLKMDSNNRLRKSETLISPKGQSLLTTYVNAPNYDSLRFVGPDGRQYMWVSHAPVSAVRGARHDTLRHALFRATYNHDPLYGEIVADHAFWDGYIDYNETHHGVKCNGCGSAPITGLRWKCKSCPDHNICENCRSSSTSVKSACFFTLVNLPDEALYIRSKAVDPALVVATLQILKDWELHTLRWERMRDPGAFAFSEENIRKGDLGRIRYWKAGDFDKNGQLKSDGQVFGTAVKMQELFKVAAEVASALGDAGRRSTSGGGGGGGGGDGKLRKSPH